MGRYLSNLLRAGARPIGRRGGPVRRAPIVPVLNAERFAPPPEPTPSPAAQATSALSAKSEPAAVEPQTRPPAPEPEPELVEPEAQAAPLAAPVPPPVLQAAMPREREPEEREALEPEPVTEVAVLPHAAQAAGNTSVRANAGAEPVLSRTTPEAPRRKAPAPRTPAPAQVETTLGKTPGAAIERLAGHRDVRPPQRLLEGPPRVEFITSERVVTLLAKTPTVQQEHAPSRTAMVTAKKSETRRESPPPPPPPPAPAPKAELKPAIATASSTVARREPVLLAPVPSYMPPQPPAATPREPETSVQIRQLDVQIVMEEPRRSARRSRPVSPPPQESRSRGFERYYIREVV